jgi:plastocyanin
MGKRITMYTFYSVICLGILLAIASIASAEQPKAVKSDAETAAELKLLLGDGMGVTDTYLAKNATRLQSATISLRLQGKLDEAMAYQAGTSNFLDANLVNSNNRNIMAYLYDHPELGWVGSGNGKFEPLANVSSQQLYKVLLEILGYRSNTDFKYADTESFAASKGLTQIANTRTLTNAHIATALVEALSSETVEDVRLFAVLQTRGVIDASAQLYNERIENSDEVDGSQESIVKIYEIDIREFSFGTGPLTVEAGSKIVFTNYDDMQHDAVAVDGAFTIPLLSKGESHTITLAEPGTYDYYCTPHKQFMTGQIIVK